MWRFVVEEAGRSKLQAVPRWMRRLSSLFFWRQQSSRVGWNVVDRRCRRGTVLSGRMVLCHGKRRTSVSTACAALDWLWAWLWPYG